MLKANNSVYSVDFSLPVTVYGNSSCTNHFITTINVNSNSPNGSVQYPVLGSHPSSTTLKPTIGEFSLLTHFKKVIIQLHYFLYLDM